MSSVKVRTEEKYFEKKFATKSQSLKETLSIKKTDV